MEKIYHRKKKPPQVIVCVRISPEEKHKLKIVCAELNISIQEFIRRLLSTEFKNGLEK